MKPPDHSGERSAASAREKHTPHPARAEELWEEVFSSPNLDRALRRVERNGGAPGIDGMATTDLRPWFRAHWPEARQALDAGTYRPAPVRRVEIPKPSGGMRVLGVPTVVDRLIQQAVLQVLTPIFDPGFSQWSFGGPWVVDVDLDRFFDRVNHDALMARVARRIGDRRLLKLIRRYLEAGAMSDGVVVEREEGTPQGSPLSPLLANIMLDDLDTELERRGHRFVRYADDLRVYVGTRRAAERVLDGLCSFIEHRLKLRVNRDKSGVASATRRGLLGFGFYKRDGKVKVRVDRKAIKAVKVRIRRLTARNWGVSMAHRIAAVNRFVLGWCAYFAWAETPSVFAELDEWLRRRLRQVQWKQWKRVRTRLRELARLGVKRGQAWQWANTRRGSWRVAGSAILGRALPNAHWRALGLLGFAESYGLVRAAW